MTRSERLYRVLLQAYPGSYRREYEEPMMQHFRDQLRGVSGASQLMLFWIRTMLDLARTAPIRHLENRLPWHGFARFTSGARTAIFFARHAVRRIEAMEVQPRRRPDNREIPLSQECKRAFHSAIKEARALGETGVTTRHLVRAIRQQEATLASRVLRDHSVEGL
ncbi:MAG: hypothetical protein ABJF23_24960 [Bryobacteraceae bacterium]